MKYAVAIFPTKKLQDLANSYRKRYDPSYSLVPPHIKIKSPFEINEEDLKDITDKFHKIASETKPLPIHVYKVKSFHPTTNVIYFAVKKTDELYELHDKLHQGKWDTIKEYSYVPHITIGQGLSDQEHSDVIGRLAMMNIDHSETVDRFHLMYQLENGSWTVHETFRLGQSE